MNYCDNIKEYIEIEKKTLDALDVEAINKVINLFEESRQKQTKVYIFGNGGSAATASHMTNDFNKGLSESLDLKFNFVCLCDNVATMTAIANDISYDEVYRMQLKGRLHKEDIVVAISGSGNSKNIVNAVEYAKELRATVVGITGYNGGKLKEMADYSLHAPVNSMQVAEDIHMIFDHLMMSMLYKELCGINHLRG